MNETIIKSLQEKLEVVKIEHGFKPNVLEKISDIQDLSEQIPVDPEQIMDVFKELLLAIELVHFPNMGTERDAYVQMLVMKNINNLTLYALINQLDGQFDCGCG